MSKGFTRKQLVNQCGFSQEEADLILDYQKKIPILVENDGIEGFCVNARDLWTQLKQPYGQFSKWINARVKSYSLIESIDFTTFSTNVLKAEDGRPAKEYNLTLDVAKQLAMVEKNESGVKTRRYFLLMEKTVQKMTRWVFVREPLKKLYKEMERELSQYLLRTIQRSADDWDYKIEANALNIIATGFKAQDIRNFVKCQDNITRDSLTTIYNEYLLKLEEWNIIFLRLNMNRYERYLNLRKYFDATFPNYVPLKDFITKDEIEKNKDKLIDEVRENMEGVA